MLRRRHFRWSDAGEQNNAQATRAESTQTVLIKTARPPRRLTASLRSVSVGASRPVVSSKHENFGEGLCVRWRQLDRGVPGGGSEVLWSPCRAADPRTSQGTLRLF